MSIHERIRPRTDHRPPPEANPGSMLSCAYKNALDKYPTLGESEDSERDSETFGEGEGQLVSSTSDISKTCETKAGGK